MMPNTLQCTGQPVQHRTTWLEINIVLWLRISNREEKALGGGLRDMIHLNLSLLLLGPSEREKGTLNFQNEHLICNNPLKKIIILMLLTKVASTFKKRKEIGKKGLKHLFFLFFFN